MNSDSNGRNQTNRDPSKMDLYAMLTDEQLREYLASPRTDERLRARLNCESARRTNARREVRA